MYDKLIPLPLSTCIECPECGFREHPNETCEEYRRGLDRQNFDAYTIYVCRADKLYKIGYTIDLQKRLKSLRVGNAYKVEVICELYVGGLINARVYEKLLHERFMPRRIRGEWFALTNKDVNWLKMLDLSMTWEPTQKELDRVVGERVVEQDIYKHARGRRVTHKQTGEKGTVFGADYCHIIVVTKKRDKEIWVPANEFYAQFDFGWNSESDEHS